MKKFLATLALLPILASCSLPWGGSSTSPAPAAVQGGGSIVGKWKLQAMSLPRQEAEIAKQTSEIQSAFKSQVEEVVSKSNAEFNADGSFTISVADVSTKGTYKVSADGKVITTTIPQADGSAAKSEDINIVSLTKEQMVLRSAVAAEDGTAEELILTWVPAAGQ